MAAKKKPLAVWSIADLGGDDDAGSRSIVIGARERTARSAGHAIVQKARGQQLVAFLAEPGLV
jgi:electron transfer flavoprotein alpha/beta subunit